jgi:hypothetical protein
MTAAVVNVDPPSFSSFVKNGKTLAITSRIGFLSLLLAFVNQIKQDILH